MKKVLLCLTVTAASFVANAQTKFGLKGGLNLANLKIFASGFNVSLTNRVGFHAGGFATVTVAPNVNLQPEAVFSMEGSRSGDSKVNLSYLNVPVLFQYQSREGIFGETGPQLGLLLSAKSIDAGDTEDIKEDCKSVALSWAIGAGYRLANGVGLHARYNIGLTNIVNADDADGSLKSNVAQFGLSVAFGGKK